jgi:hypothetical protein
MKLYHAICSFPFLVGIGVNGSVSAAETKKEIDSSLSSLVERADLIVGGKIERLDRKFEQRGKDPKERFVLGVIQIKQTFKGYLKAKEIYLAWPASPSQESAKSKDSKQMVYKKGQEGIWLLIKDKKFDMYWANLAEQFESPEQSGKIKEIVKKLKPKPRHIKIEVHEGIGIKDSVKVKVLRGPILPPPLPVT